MRKFVHTVATIAFAASCVATASAQLPACPESAVIEGWEAGDLHLATAGSSRPAAPTGFELCGASAGFGDDDDSYRFLTRRQGGNFAFEAEIATVSPGGSAGIVARRSQRGPASAHVRITVRLDAGGVTVDSGFRRTDGVPASLPGASVSGLALPLRLRIERRGNTFTTAYADATGQFVPHLTAELPALEGSLLAVGMMQASGADDATAAASFSDAGFVASAVPRADTSGCAEAVTAPESGGAAATLRGAHLDHVRAIHVAGRPAEIVDAAAERLVFTVPEGPGGIAHAPVVIDEEHGSTTLPLRVVWAGRPFVRGDLDGSGRLSRGDLRRLDRYLQGRGPALSCPEAADVDGNGRIDADDLTRLAGVLAGTAAAPPAPYPAAGFAPDGGLACGLPRAPRIRLVRSGSGAALPADAELREGDVVEIRGSGFPRDPERATVLFGDVLTRVLEGSTPARSVRRS